MSKFGYRTDKIVIFNIMILIYESDQKGKNALKSDLLIPYLISREYTSEKLEMKLIIPSIGC